MKWNNSIEIEASIDSVWTILTTGEYSEKIMPKLVNSVLIKEDGNVKVFSETYREGKREETYELTVTILEESKDSKKQKFHFIIANTIETEGYYYLSKIGDDLTRFEYSGENTGVNLMGKIMMGIAKLFANDKESREYVERVKFEAEKLYNTIKE